MWIIQISIVGLPCWAGPLICAAVVIPENEINEAKEWNDKWFAHISEMSVREIDRTNTFQADIKLKTRTIKELTRFLPPTLPIKYVESKSIVAFPSKWTVKNVKEEPKWAFYWATKRHNEIMESYHQRFPEWGFDQHKGYETPDHRKLILKRKEGSKVHRRSFMPLARFYANQTGRKTDTGNVKQKKLREAKRGQRPQKRNRAFTK